MKFCLANALLAFLAFNCISCRESDDKRRYWTEATLITVGDSIVSYLDDHPKEIVDFTKNIELLEQLRKKGYLIESDCVDSWGQAINFRYENKDSAIVIWSSGLNKKNELGKGDDLSYRKQYKGKLGTVEAID